MSINKTEVLKRIKDTFNAEAHIPNNLRLPRDIEFVISGNDAEMWILNDAVGKNMQEDKASFEGWALVLKRWGKFDRVILGWDRPQYDPSMPESAHYQRFLFRVKSFLLDFKLWFSVSPKCQTLLNDLKIDDVNNYYLSPPYNERANANLRGKEAILEYQYSLGKWSELLRKITNADYLNRQLPVGVFYKPVSNKTKILPKNKSAIDIWGISKKNELLIFELKADGNNKVGIITELYFYCCVMQSVRKGQFLYEKYDILNLSRISKTNKIIGYFLAPKLHPLIDKALVDIINLGMAPDVRFNYLRFPADSRTPITLIY